MSTFDLRTFTPAEAAKISGVNVALQRDWRRRDILPKVEGHARFSPFDIGEMMALNSLGAQGVQLLQYRSILKMLGAGVMMAALQLREAYSGAFDGIVNIETPEIIDHLRHTHVSDRQNVVDRWRAVYARDRILRKEGHEANSVRTMFIHWADNSFAFSWGPIAAYETIEPSDPRRAGAIVMVDLEGLGHALIKRSGAIVDVKPRTPGGVASMIERKIAEALAGANEGADNARAG
ncbi:hypothetical protein [Brevundimonas sp.]|uniref:hypothetical protein n=1 Tax=Brevundimonas sp. TaxID=1871086 RepID=UPI0028ABDEA4|nr:hypothetical protein [Brevundimonas sp.]